MSRLYADLTQSWSERGGGVRTYINRKRRFVLERTNDRHLLIIPGPADRITEEGRAITVEIRSPHVPGSPNYRLLLRNGAVHTALEQFQPDLIECQDAYNLPWAALAHRRRHPGTAVVGSFMTDFPKAYVQRAGEKLFGRTISAAATRLAYRYCAALYRRCDEVVALSEHGGADRLRDIGVERIAVVPLGVDIEEFDPALRDEAIRRRAGAAQGQPLLIYVGRLDREKRAATVVDAFQRLPASLGAKLALLGSGPLRDELAKVPGVFAPGYVSDRGMLARWLASADLYVSGMADETFGISVIEAQASGLPVVGVAAGAMIDRVPSSIGRLGPVDDPEAMAANIVAALTDQSAAKASAAAREIAASYSWDAAMERLFETVYPAAFEQRIAAMRREALRVPAASRRLANDEAR